jgi:hypothetical protein
VAVLAPDEPDLLAGSCASSEAGATHHPKIITASATSRQEKRIGHTSLLH